MSCFQTGVQFARAEGCAGARSQSCGARSHRRSAALQRRRVAKTILLNLCGHGHFDMQAYMDFFAGKLKDQSYSEEELALALAGLPSEQP